MKQLVEFRVLVDLSCDKDSVEKLDRAILQVARGMRPSLKVFGLRVVGTEFGHKTPTREESIRLTPKKMHHGMLGIASCGREVVVARTTQDWEKVTCRKCKGKRPEPQKELF